MKEIGAFEAKNKFGQLLDWVEAGDEVVITRRGKVVARLVPPPEPSITRPASRQRRAFGRGGAGSRLAG